MRADSDEVREQAVEVCVVQPDGELLSYRYIVKTKREAIAKAVAQIIAEGKTYTDQQIEVRPLFDIE